MRLLIVVNNPLPEIDPGLIVQVPAGSPFSTTDPVDPGAQLGAGVIVPIVGAEGAPGAGLIVTLADAADVHPEALVTVKL